jgi:uncharacterized membrane protein
MFLGQHRAAFLEFLRNLTPQVLLFTIGLVYLSTLDTTHFVWTGSGLKNAVPLIAIFVVLGGAMMANFSRFLEEMTAESAKAKETLQMAREEGKGRAGVVNNVRLFGRLLWLSARHDGAVFRWFLAVVVVQVSMIALFVQAYQAANLQIHRNREASLCTQKDCSTVRAERHVRIAA